MQGDPAHRARARELRPHVRVGEPGEHQAVDRTQGTLFERIHSRAHVIQEIPGGFALSDSFPFSSMERPPPIDHPFGPF